MEEERIEERFEQVCFSTEVYSLRDVFFLLKIIKFHAFLLQLRAPPQNFVQVYIL